MNESQKVFDTLAFLMLVFRLTDENVRRNVTKSMVPKIPSKPEGECDDRKVSQTLYEWMVRYESYKEHVMRHLPQMDHAQLQTEEQFQSLIQSCIQEASLIADASLLQKKRMALIVCKRCNSDDVEKEDRQTRSADEGTTGFYRCNKCSHSWKHSG